ncbi:hypothetical protein V8F33_008333 [Rhypophila sp. PSN 637]
MKPLSQFLLWGLLPSAGLASSSYQKQLGDLDLDSRTQTSAPSYRKHLLDIHKQLVEISSISGHEVPVANFLHTYLPTLGFETWLQALPASNTSWGYLPERYNVVARFRSDSSAAARVLVTSHIDVVPPYIPYHIDAPSSDEITCSTIISGRGSVDAKASVAAQIIAVEELVASKAINPSDVMLLFVVGEETLGDGMRFFSDNLQSHSNSTSLKAAIFGEPTENKLACGHKGITFGSIRAEGKAGHSGYPWLGKSATEVLIRALGKILEHDFGKSERYGNTTVNIGKIEGGVAANVIPKVAQAEISLRIAIGHQKNGADIIRKQLKQILEDVDSEALSLESKGGYGPIECFCDVDGFETMVANYGTDVPHLAGDHVSYLYGPGSILVAHGDDEALRVGDLEEAVEGYKKLIKHALEA